MDAEDAFGWELLIDLYQCNPEKVRSRDVMVEFIITLCDDVLKMKRYGEPWAERFGLNHPVTAGYSVVQLIETSSIVAHFSELKNSVYLDIFSCRPFDPAVVIDFCRQYFEAGQVVDRFFQRQ